MHKEERQRNIFKLTEAIDEDSKAVCRASEGVWAEQGVCIGAGHSVRSTH